MTNQKLKFSEQAINKVAEVAIARLLDAKQLSVQIKTTFKQLARGEIEAIAIDMNDVKIRQNLRVESLQLQIGRVAVNPRKAALGKIELVQPSEGTMQVVMREQQLTTVLNSDLARNVLQEEKSLQIAQIRCEFQDEGAIALICEWIEDSNQEKQTSTVITTPQISANGQEVVLEKKEEQVFPLNLDTVVMSQISDILSLRDLRNRGTVLQIQQIDIGASSVTICANSHIEEFPS